ncbi:MAG: ABC transporter ATP-binding protein [Anaerolineaceae bacterium]|nr:ABC transporter ATP-binding protein [Anaerolineaceae bacterium]MBN2676556.1 ABC transporter ATP-binding protein [Anaerolineaceae bacterium]HER63650.1 ABC transporter ATP-binding protein [Desulfobacteraceae bacterium]
MSVAPILAFHQVGFGYAKNLPEAVSRLNFTVPPGSITAILGPNGAGKTTLLHLALGLLHPRFGEIEVGGKNICEYRRRELSRLIGLVPQNEYLPYEFSVLEYVVLGRSPYLGPLDMPDPKNVAIAREALKTVSIAHLADRVVHELSGGEIQLVIVARALAQQPRILLLDEPTSHLDLANKHTILKILHELARTGVTVVFSTHDPDAASEIADRLVLMRNGRVLDAGHVDQVFTAEKLTKTYGIPVKVVQLDGLKIALHDEKYA